MVDGCGCAAPTRLADIKVLTGASGERPAGITLGNAPMFVDLKFSGRRLFWLCAIICYVRVESHVPSASAKLESGRAGAGGEEEREVGAGWSTPFAVPLEREGR